MSSPCFVIAVFDETHGASHRPRAKRVPLGPASFHISQGAGADDFY
jgi:hypothetical protein